MSKYPVQYVGSKGASDIEALPNGHIHNAAKKIENLLADSMLTLSPNERARQEQVLACLKQEIAEREAQREQGAQP